MTTRSLPQTSNARQSRALDLVKTGETRPYTTTETSCTCPDFTYRHVACKHILALRVQTALDTPVWAVSIPWTVGPLTCTYQGVPCKIVSATMTESGDPNVTIETLDGLATLHTFSHLRHHTGPVAISTLTVARSILEEADPASWEKIAASASSRQATPPTPAQAQAKPAPTTQTNPLEVDGFEITRLDFFVKDGDVSGAPLVIVQRLAVTSPVRGDHVIVATEEKPVDLEAAAAWLHKNGYCTRRWPAVVTPTYQKPAGMRAWKADQPWPVRTEGQIRKLRTQLNGHTAGIGHSLNLAFDL